MSTTVVVARDYRTASEVAGHLGLGQDWLYPHSPAMLRGMVIESVVYVDGWLSSPSITVDTATAVQTRLAADARVVIARRGPTEPPAPISAPFVEPVAPESTQGAPRPSRHRRGTPAWLLVLAVAASAFMGGGVLVHYGRIVGWW